MLCSSLVQKVLFEVDGNILCCCLNAVSLALLDFGLPCTTVLAAISAAFVDGHLLFDPTLNEIQVKFFSISFFFVLPKMLQEMGKINTFLTYRIASFAQCWKSRIWLITIIMHVHISVISTTIDNIFYTNNLRYSSIIIDKSKILIKIEKPIGICCY